MNAQADWWLLLVGLGIGAGLTWLVVAEMRRRDDDVTPDERAIEAAWIADTLSAEGTEADTAGIEEVLRLHRLYLASLPFDEPAWVSGTPTWPPTPVPTPSDPPTPPDPPTPSDHRASEFTPEPPSAGDATPVEGDRPEGKPTE